jgi:uncharacterized repeat protein (TIGR01451 family)
MMRIATFFLLLGWLTSVSSTVYGQCAGFSVELLPTHPTCESVQNGALTVAVTGATPPINYTWSDGANEDTRTSLGVGDYEVTVTDADGCTAEESVTLTGLMELDLGGDMASLCEDEVLMLGNEVAEANSIYFTSLPGGFQLEFVDGDENAVETETRPGYIGINPPPISPLSTPDALQLYIGSAQADAGETVCVPVLVDNFENISGMAFNIKFNPDLLELQSIFNINMTLPWFSSVNFNSNSETGVIECLWVEPTLSSPVTLPDNSTLFELCFQVQGTIGNYEYEWAGPDGFSADTSVVTATSPGTYSVTLTESGNSGCVLQDDILVIFDDSPVIEIPDTLYTCGDSVLIAPEVSCAGNAPIYSWSTGENSESITVLPASPQQYSLTVTTAGGQSSTDSVLVIPSTPPDLAPIDDITLCEGDEVTVTANATGGALPYTFVWNDTISGPTTTLSTFGAPSLPTTVIVIDSLGCSDTTDFTILSDNINVAFLPDERSLCGGTVELSPQVSGIVATPTYLWSTGATTSAITVSQTGTYYVTVESSNGCVSSDSVEVVDNNLTATISTTDVSCNGGSDGCIFVIATGGTPPYEYQWMNGQIGSTICGLSAGIYTVAVTDVNGCFIEISAALDEPPLLDVIVLEEAAPSCPNAPDGALSVQVTGGTPPYAYRWSDNQTGPSTSGLTAGSYTVTVSDVFGCTVINDYLLEASSDAEVVADAGPGQTITCAYPFVTLDGSGSSTGPEYTYEWIGPFGEVYTGLNVVTSFPGIYTLNVTNTNTPSCTTSDAVIVLEDFETPTVSLVYDLINCDSARITYTSSLPLASLNWNLPDGSTSNSDTLFTTLSGLHELTGQGADNGCLFYTSIELPTFPEDCITLQGQLRHDTLQNCQIEPDEPSLSNWMIAVAGNNGQTFYAVTQADGQYQQQVPIGQYELSPILPANDWQPCQPSYTVNADTPNDTITQDLLVQSLDPCPQFEVDVSLPILRRCWERNISIHYCNIGTGDAEDAFITVLLDEQFTYIDASLPLLDQDGQLLTFDLGDVPVNDCGDFSVMVAVSCDAAVGEALCVEAKAFPNEPCAPPSNNWSGASLLVSTVCEDEEVSFRIENIGDDMTQGQQYIVIEDGVMLLVMPDTVLLAAQESYEFRLPATGATYRLEAEQVPFHPEQSTPVAVLEGCGTDEFGSFSTGFVNQFDLGDEDTFVDIECGEVIAAYDPNDKNGYPLGHGPEHNIYPGTELEYRVRFQNTGNDTAFLVVIKDTIDTEVLDLTTLRPGASSHPYTWDIEEESTLVFTFENILLPDSMTNELGSQGFVDFKIQHQPNLPLGTQIKNRAGIYFDINPPIMTNTSLHTLNRGFLETITHTVSPVLQAVELLVIPNPARERALIQLQQWPADGGWIELFDPLGRSVLRQRFEGQQIELERRNWAAGWYSFRITTEQGSAISGQMVWR